MLTIENLSKSYGRTPVLRGISATFGDGSVCGIAGANGAGKTTLFQCLAGILPYEGRIAHTRHAVLKNALAYAPAEPQFFPRTTGREYLEFIRHARGETEVPPEALQLFELPLDDYIHRYSTGMKRKLVLMGTAIGPSDVLLLDEPFNGVDLQSNLQLKRRIRDWKDAGKTVLLSSHILASLTELCDAIFLLRNGTFERRYGAEEYGGLEGDLLQP